MVSFSCEGCGDVLTKKKLDPHRNQCWGASFTCIDCMVHFQGTEYREHTSCISEAQKYQGALYRPAKEKKAKENASKALVPQKAYVQDEEDEFEPHVVVEDKEEQAPPEAPTPPSAVPDFQPTEDVNVFDFLVDSETPNASTIELAAREEQRRQERAQQQRMLEDTPVPKARDERASVHFYEDDQAAGMLVQYGSGPVTSTSAYETPAHRGAERRKTKEKEGKKDDKKSDKKDKKRKRLHVDTDHAKDNDEVMTDAPPVLHSGLTGGLNRLLRPNMFPPSPDYSGDNANEASPASPVKRSKHSKRERESTSTANRLSTNIMSLISSGTSRKDKSKDSKTPKDPHGDDDSRPRKQHRAKRRESSSQPKMIEFASDNGGHDGGEGDAAQMIIYGEAQAEDRAELFMSFINKGPQSERGCSVNKALKRYHRERLLVGIDGRKLDEEKELWRSVRLKKNDRGEIVLFF